MSDDAVRAVVNHRLVDDVMRSCLLAEHAGTMQSPPRLRIDVNAGLVISAGGLVGGAKGFRAYGLWDGADEQVVVVWGADGRLTGVVLGSALGAYRTGALGGVAVDVLAHKDADTVAVLGSGRQAWSQLWACSHVRKLSRVTVTSPTNSHAQAFADRARVELGVPVIIEPDARAAVAAAAIVLVATNSRVPVIECDWLAPGSHVSSVGPKSRGASEMPAAIGERADVIVSDSPATIDAAQYFTQRPMLSLGSILAGDVDGRVSSDQVTLYCSQGLTGSEVMLAAHLLAIPRSK